MAIPTRPSVIRKIQVRIQVLYNKVTHSTHALGTEEAAGKAAAVVGDGETREDIENLAVSLQQDSGEH